MKTIKLNYLACICLLVLVSCTSKSNSEEEYEEEDLIEEDFSDDEYDLVLNAEYKLTHNGSPDTWDPEEVDFSFSQLPTETEGVYATGISMGLLTEAKGKCTSATFTFYSDKLITQQGEAFTANLVHPHTFWEEKDCGNNPESCIGLGYGLVGGTSPDGGMNSLAGTDDDIHTESGTITFSDLKILSKDGGIIEGTVSGNFSIAGINTNASKPKKGEASGSFKDAPFSMLSFEK